MTKRAMRIASTAILVLALFAGCNTVDTPPPDDGFVPPIPESDVCTIPKAEIFVGAVRDGIPALTNPPLVGPDEAQYLRDTDRVIGLVLDGMPLAVPHNLLWNHEIHNYTFGDRRLAVTYCPLTGSSMVFDRSDVGGAEFGVSGLLFQNNLIMYDRNDPESFWPQMSRRAECGSRLGSKLTMIPSLEMTWGGWKALHPETRVVSDATGFPYRYTAATYPYGNYEQPDDGDLLFPLQIDDRRLPKERVLGIPDGRRGGVALPFFELDAEEPVRAVRLNIHDGPAVVFWDRAAQGGGAFRPDAGGQTLTFGVDDDRLVDAETGSTWRLDGLAVDGPLAGSRLTPIPDAFVAFWFAWAAFHPETTVWTSD